MELDKLFPQIYRSAICKMQTRGDWTELYLRIGQPALFYAGGKEYQLLQSGEYDSEDENHTRYLVQKEDLQWILQQATQATPIVFRDEIGQGYLTLEGGHRLGFAGEVYSTEKTDKGQPYFKHINGMMLRIAREMKGCAKSVLPFLLGKNEVLNTLVISPPGCGKTTLLRDLSRCLSNGEDSMDGKKVVVIDERMEIASSYQGIPQFDIGSRTNVICGCKKALGFVMAVRSLSPEILIADEIGFEEESRALLYGIYSGCRVICSTHGGSLEEVQQRNGLQPLFAEGIFKRYILLGRRKSHYHASVYDEKGGVLLG